MRQGTTGPASPGPKPGQTIIAIHSGYWVLCILAAVIAIFFLIAAIASGDGRLQLIGPIVFVLSGGGALFILHELRLRIVLDDEELLAERPWQRPVRLRWTNIATVAFSSTLTSFVMSDHEGKKLRVPALGRGIGTLTEQLRNRVAEPIWRQALDDYRRIMRRSA